MKNKYPQFPQAKTENLVVQELPGELLVYDLKKNKAYDLNQTSALVWQYCDGTKSINEIAKILEKQLNQKVPDELIWLTLEKLKKEGLVDFEKEHFSEFTNVGRRELLKRASLVSLVALPIIVSLVAPVAAQTSSGAPAPVPCQACVMKSDGIGECPSVCDQNVLGTCYSNSGCGAGQAVASGVTCQDCFTGVYEPQPCNIPAIPGIPNAPGCGTLSWSAPD
jgi:hypothetical protein